MRRVPGILDAIGVGMLGPTIIAHGTDEQKSRYLGSMLHGDEVWCQLFSEPAAGSDLAAVQARARLQDDGSWRLTGQKVWTTNAQFASYGLLLARTDADVPKHKGLTMFVVPMDGEGVTVRGLRQISGEAEFNEVFFDDVALDSGAVVGGVGNGWGTALTTLMYERVTIGLGGEGLGYNPNRFATAIADDEHARRDPEVRHQLGELSSELLAVRFTGYRTLTALQKGQIPGPEAGLAKVTIVNGAIKAGELIADVLGPDALAGEQRVGLHDLVPARPEVGGRDRGDPAQHDRRARARPAPGAPPGQGHPVLGAALQGSDGGMSRRSVEVNLSLSDEQVFLREAARGALSRFKTFEAAREALDGDEAALPDLWPVACEAGWPGLLIDEDHDGAGLDVFDAMLVLGECGRVLASVPLLGHLPATAILGDAPNAAEFLPALARGSGERPTCPREDRTICQRTGAPTPCTALSEPSCRGPRLRARTDASSSTGASRSYPTLPGQTCSSEWPCSRTARSEWRSSATPPGSRCSPWTATTPPARSATSR